MSEQTKTSSLFTVISASSVGTLIEWYEFYIYGSLATIISTQFFPKGNPTAALLATLATFAAGFIVRPFGALFFGRLGDLIGRKYTFLVTLVIMGGSTFLIGCIPGYETIGMAAPILMLLLRLLQGLALGGEYGGAATYVAEHAPEGRKGYFTSWIQTTATLGLFLSLGVIVLTRSSLGVDTFTDWGWRVPFWISIALVGVSIYIRLKMSESPAFTKIKNEGKISANPLKESFGNKQNFKVVLLALLGATMGQGVVWYTGQFYAQSFIENICNVEFDQSRTIVMWALGLGTAGFVIFGSLSDRIGRKGIMLTGMLLAVLSYRVIYEKMYQTTNLKNKTEIVEKTTVETTGAFVKGSTTDSLYTTTTLKEFADGTKYKEVKKITVLADKAAELPKPDIKKSTTISSSDYWTLVFLVFIQVIYVTMVYGPIAAFLVELFPTRIRYTSMSLPYHIGNGVFGGLVPFIATALVTTAKAANEAAEKAGQALPVEKPYLEGLWYPIIIACVSFLIGAIYLTTPQPPKGVQDRLFNLIKKIKNSHFGGWAAIFLGLTAAYFLLTNYWTKIGDESTEENIKAIVFVFVLTPIITGALVRFGLYALQGEYDEKQ
jgi:MFS family permease